MRRLVVPLIVGMIVCLMTATASAQTSIYDTLGFGETFTDTLRAEPGDYIDLPVFLSTDSIVTGLSMLFEFDTSIFWPVIAFDQGYQNLIDAGGYVPDSNEYQASPVMDSGLWNVDMYLSSKTASTWNAEWGAAQVLYNLNDRGHMRLLLTPIPPFDTLNYDPPYIEGELGDDGANEPDDDGGGIILYIKFRIKPDDNLAGVTSKLILERQNEDNHKTEIAQQWDSAGLILTRALRPVFDTAVFIAEADTGGGGPGPDPDENEPPELFVGGDGTYNINPGQQVSFTVSATDAEGGELRISCNNGSLPPNATFGTGGQVIGGGGSASGVFSFVPDVTQQGTFVFSFVATDDSSATSATKTSAVVVAAPEKDILYTSSAPGLAPQGGVPGLKEVMVPINVVTNNVIYGIQFNMAYDANNFDLDSIITSDRTAEWVIYDDIGVDPGKVKVVAFGLANDSMVPGTTSAALYMAFSVDQFAKIGGYPLDIDSAWESIDPDPNVPSIELETDSGVIYVDRWGDVNLDQRIDVADLVSSVSYIIRTYDLSRRQFAAADIMINDTVNVVDLVGIINTIFGLPVSPAPAYDLEGEFAALKVASEGVPETGTEGAMKIQADLSTEVAGVELEIQYNPNTVEMLKPLLTEASRDFRISSSDNGAGRMKVLIYSDHPWDEQELLQQGLSDIIRLPYISRGTIPKDGSHVRITEAYVSNGSAKNVPVEGVGGPALPISFELYQNRPNPFNPTTTIDFYVGGDGLSGEQQVTLEVFNLLGQQVKTLVDRSLPAGQHSVIWDGRYESGEPAASGIYLYRLRVGDQSRSRKMMLLK